MLEKENNYIQINGSNIDIGCNLIEENNIIYLPISKMQNVYNIKINYLEEQNNIIIDFLDNNQNQAVANKKIDVKWISEIFSKTVDTIEQGENVIVIEKQEEWYKVLTRNGAIGFVKRKDMSNQYCYREKNQINIKPTNLSNLLTIDLNDYINITTYEQRLAQIEDILNTVLKQSREGVFISNYQKTNENDRLIIELIPRLREIGMKIGFENEELISNQIKSLTL